VKIALYCPNKPLRDPDPSGDLSIARSLEKALVGMGHDCREAPACRTRWFWKSRRGLANVLAGFCRAFRWTVSFRPNVWLTYHTYYKSPDIIGPALTRMLSIPYVLFQPMYSTKRGKAPETRIGFNLNRLALLRARQAFTNNINDIEALRRILPKEKITYLPPGIFPEDFCRDVDAGFMIRESHGIPRDTPLLMTAARFRPGVKFQSLSYLFRSLMLLKNSQVPFLLLVVGDGPMEGRLRAMADELLPGQIVFSGRISREELWRYYSAADVFVFPGIGESLGMVFLEAQACALPVVALDVAGVPQVVRVGKSALLAAKDDGKGLAEALNTLIKDPELRQKMGAKGRQFIRENRNLHHNYLELDRWLQSEVMSLRPNVSD
jgi:glycosyltransferase involved in cell wall biosynthesis